MSVWNLSERFETSQGTVRWTCWGQGSPVVFLHGTPFSSYVWRDVADAISSRHTVFAWDMLGYGQSEMREGQDVSLATQGRVFADLLEHWGLTKPLVVAHDFGGTVALRAHLLHGAVYRRLALIDPVALAPWGTGFFRLVGEHAEAFRRLPPELHRALVREYVSSASNPGLHPAGLDDLVEPWLGDRGQPALYRQMTQADQRYTEEARIATVGSTFPSWCAGVPKTRGCPRVRHRNWSPASRARSSGSSLRLVISCRKTHPRS